MKDTLEQSRIELRRAEHLLYVSLKYSRTVDVIKNVLERLISTLETSIDALLIKKIDEKKIDKMPELPRMKIETAKKLYNDTFTQEFIDFYIYLRTLQKSPYDAQKEYRRHVTMIAHIPEGNVNVDIDKIAGYYQRTVWYVMHAHTICGEDEQQVSTKHV